MQRTSHLGFVGLHTTDLRNCASHSGFGLGRFFHRDSFVRHQVRGSSADLVADGSPQADGRLFRGRDLGSRGLCLDGGIRPAIA